MNPFLYQKPSTPAQASAAARPTAAFIAGGTNVLDIMKKHIAQPETLIDVTTALSHEIVATAGGLRIGAMVRNTAIAENSLVNARFPLLAKAVLAGASPQIRHMASAAGNLLQRTRCPYFYDTSLPCNKREPGTGCSAWAGEQRYAAIVGYSKACVAVHPSDMCVALAALEATVVLQERGKPETRMPFALLHRLPGDTPHIDTQLPAQALITGIELADNPFGRHHAYVKLRDRDSYAFALVSVAAALHVQGNTIVAARLASGGVAHKPWRWTAIEAFLKGKKPSDALFATAAEMLSQHTQPLPGNVFKLSLLKGACTQALQQCMAS